MNYSIKYLFQQLMLNKRQINILLVILVVLGLLLIVSSVIVLFGIDDGTSVECKGHCSTFTFMYILYGLGWVMIALFVLLLILVYCCNQCYFDDSKHYDQVVDKLREEMHKIDT